MRPFSKLVWPVTLVIVLGGLGGCSEYLDRRDTIAFSAGNALAGDKVTQMVDPWPAESANRNIAFNGAKIEGAMQRYRTNQVTPPVGNSTSGSYQPPPNAANTLQADPTASPPPPVH